MTEYKTDMTTKPKRRRSADSKLPFGRILSAIMQDRTLTLKQLAEMSGASVSTVSDWCAGTHPHDLKAIHKLARSLGVSFSYLLLGVSDEVGKATTVGEMFEEADLFEGICRVSIKKLNVRK